MRNFRTLMVRILCLSLAFSFTECSSESILEEPHVAESSSPPQSPLISSIQDYLRKNHKGTRANSYQLIPYTVEGDTIMYIAQYSEGWELFSNSYTAPMSLMKNGAGHFDPLLLNANPAFRTIFHNMVAALKANKSASSSDTLPGADQWKPYKGLQKSIDDPNDNYPPVYTPVGSFTVSEEQISVPHLIKTHWHQNYPYNFYMPFKSNSSEHRPTGCTAVAFGQFFYYTHYKWGTPMEIPSKATYDPATNTYVFTDFNSSQWSKMPYEAYTVYEDTAVPTLLGWIAKMINAWPSEDNEGNAATSAYLKDAVKFANGILSNDLTIEKYSQNKVISMLKDSKPIILELILKGTNSGHVVIIDDVEASETYVETYYAYVDYNSDPADPDPDPVPGPIGGNRDDYYNYLVSKFGQVYIESNIYTCAKFRFNWGWGSFYISEYDETYVDGNVLSFAIPDDSNHIYQYNQICTYSVK